MFHIFPIRIMNSCFNPSIRFSYYPKSDMENWRNHLWTFQKSIIDFLWKTTIENIMPIFHFVIVFKNNFSFPISYFHVWSCFPISCLFFNFLKTKMENGRWKIPWRGRCFFFFPPHQNLFCFLFSPPKGFPPTPHHLILNFLFSPHQYTLFSYV